MTAAAQRSRHNKGGRQHNQQNLRRYMISFLVVLLSCCYCCHYCEARHHHHYYKFRSATIVASPSYPMSRRWSRRSFSSSGRIPSSSSSSSSSPFNGYGTMSAASTTTTTLVTASSSRTMKQQPQPKPTTQKQKRGRGNNNNSNSNDSSPPSFDKNMSNREIPTQEELYYELGPIGKCVAGVTQIAVTTIMEYVTGFMAGIFIGSVAGIPGFVLNPLDKNPANPGTAANAAANSRLPIFMKEVSGRFSRMNTRSMKWAKTWGYYSATFGGSRIAIKVLRGGREDDWNTIISSAIAGAFFARTGTCNKHMTYYIFETISLSPSLYCLNPLSRFRQLFWKNFSHTTCFRSRSFFDFANTEGPKGMVKGALLYGGMVYLLYGGGGKRTLEGYREERIDF